MRPRRQNDGICLVALTHSLDQKCRPMIRGLDRKRLIHLEMHAEPLCALNPALFQLRARNRFRKAIVILHPLSRGEKARPLRDDRHLCTAAPRIEGRRDTCRSRTDNNNVHRLLLNV